MRPFETFDTVLVANRGEVACRIIRSARALGLGTVAVFSDADRSAAHVRMADRSVRLGPAPARDSYLRADAVIEAAVDSGAGALHPGYGFLSEDADFARSAERAGLVFVGPTPEQLALFGSKHAAREAAREVDMPMLAGSGLLADLDQALAAASDIGYPVMVKATGGGGGIGIEACQDPDSLARAFERVVRIAGASFRTPGVFVERLVTRARHLEVQVVGDGRGDVATLGDRDCTLQRRNQKVIEEAPAPDLSEDLRRDIAASATRLCQSVSYRSVGTVEFVYDVDRQQASFLEVNTRLQVEHTVTEEVWGIDLVAAMFRLADGDPDVLGEVRTAQPRGHAVEARLCAEDANRDYQPSPGLITAVSYPPGVRVDGWVEAGTEVTASYDSLLAKVIATADDRVDAFERLAEAMGNVQIHGVETNRDMIRTALDAPDVRAATHTTATLGSLRPAVFRIDVDRGGTQTTVQDVPGRLGYWSVGVPPSGPMDDASFRLGNEALGNPETAPGLEAVLSGPVLRFSASTEICVTGAPCQLRLDGAAVAMWEPFVVPAGGVVEIGDIGPPGLRAYVLFAGGLDVAPYLGSASTFTLGGFGGHGGRALRAGDVLHLRPAPNPDPDPDRPGRGPVPVDSRPTIATDWEIGVLPGPHADAEFFTPGDLDLIYGTTWEVHFNSARTGVRLSGPRPTWARTDGGEAGLHPSNIHDTPYSVGAVDFTGDLPILLGPDGPSLGGFVCPATVVTGERWKLGQLRPGDRVGFVDVGGDGSGVVAVGGDGSGVVDVGATRRAGRLRGAGSPRSGILERIPAGDGPEVTYRANGDDNLLVEYGPMVLDLALRARVHVLAERVTATGMDGIVDLTPGVRGLQIHFDPRVTTLPAVLDAVGSLETDLPASDQLEVPSREVHLPLSWDDPATREAIARYMAGVRDDAPWCPWNIEFIRRVNGLDDVEAVHQIVYDASYLVLGLGDVYLGAPLATPIDPRHRLVTTKYNPARTWTAENSVGIGGAYLCIYGMEGPGGYQFVGRTIQVWSRFRQDPPFEPGTPWLLRFFDRIRWYPVDADELLDARADMAAGRFDVRIDPGTFHLGRYQDMLRADADSIASFQDRQRQAFATEREAWRRAGEFEPRDEPAAAAAFDAVAAPPGGAVVEAPMTASVWKVDVAVGQHVIAGQPLVVLEAMKTETALVSPIDGVVLQVLVEPGRQVAAGTPTVVIGVAA